jgi:hypothetical protein
MEEYSPLPTAEIEADLQVEPTAKKETAKDEAGSSSSDDDCVIISEVPASKLKRMAPNSTPADSEN